MSTSDRIAAATIHLKQDAQLKSIVDTVELDYHWQPEQQGDVYPYLLRSIIGQQVSIQAAAAIHRRFLSLFPDEQPLPERILAQSFEDLKSVGLSKQKVQYVQNVSTYFLDHPNEDWSAQTDETIIEALTSIKGIGRWTVEVMLMFCLNRGDVFPVGDLGIQRTMELLYGLNSKGKALRTEMSSIAANWQPYRTLACYYLWSWKHRW